MPYPEILKEIRKAVQPGLDSAEQLMQQVAAISPGNLSKYLLELVKRKGKRVRAAFVLLIASYNENPPWERGARVAASIELLHLATLVHDDIIDDSNLRRNELSAHKKWGTRIAVLVGDYALSKALELIIEDEDRRVPTSVSKAASRLVAGEVLEIEQSGRLDTQKEDYFKVIYGKTASLWEACGECGGILAGFDDKLVQASRSLGKNLGFAFQMVDDMLDFGTSDENFGKETNADLQNGLVTMPLILFYENSTSDQKKEMNDLLKSIGEVKNVNRIRQMLVETGAFSKLGNMVQERIKTCTDIINSFPDNKFSNFLRRLCELVEHRKA